MRNDIETRTEKDFTIELRYSRMKVERMIERLNHKK